MTRGQRFTSRHRGGIAVIAVILLAGGGDERTTPGSSQTPRRRHRHASESEANARRRTATPKTEAAAMQAGKVSNDLDQGDTSLPVRSDEAEEVHIHGYRHQEDSSRKPRPILQASITGIFERVRGSATPIASQGRARASASVATSASLRGDCAGPALPASPRAQCRIAAAVSPNECAMSERVAVMFDARVGAPRKSFVTAAGR